MLTLAVRFYDVVVWLHVSAILIAFGPAFLYPLLVARLTRVAPEALPGIYAAMTWLSRTLISAAAIVALLAGIYLASDAHVWDEVWVTVPLVILVVLIGLIHGVFRPLERRLGALAERDIAEDRGAGRPITFSADYEQLFRRLAAATTGVSVLVLIALYFMIVKPFA